MESNLIHLAENIDVLLLEMWKKVELSPFIEQLYTAPYPVNDQDAYEIRQMLVYFEFELSMVISPPFKLAYLFP